MTPDVRDVDAVLPETLYELFMEELHRGLEPSVRNGLELLAAMPLVDRELVVTLFGAERAEELVDEALALGLLDERGGHSSSSRSSRSSWRSARGRRKARVRGGIRDRVGVLHRAKGA